ncbi:hypothetical protein F0562_004703 [Nyssa sinensis]|uniref:Protein kinase domain-containing protein n=1 Tax=Nyssa sinensis TaxID=561372 RepID=A0A5J5BZG3_9ASTE|nr:hypothetical protein F0562_004703 [Nyssa sinensis]
MAAEEDDVKCLQGVQSSLSDPQGKLSAWTFQNASAGFLCHFVGVTCWNDQQNRLISLELGEMQLTGEIPDSLQYCHVLQSLDLSSNNLSGSIPTEIYNKLSGSIPYELSSLGRLKKFSVAHNDLSGTIPSFLGAFDSSDFVGNSGLCGGPLGKCGGLSKKNLAIIIAGRTGTTYKAVLPDGSALAIERLNTCQLSEKQFRLEMNRLGQLRHPNLVPLLGFCVVVEEKLLVYKHLSNGTLYSLLNANPTVLDWPTRFRIGLGAARGLAWLHHGCQPPILHQYISSNVILLDEDFDARIMDFGLARLMALF